jgi:hypothetical protein
VSIRFFLKDHDKTLISNGQNVYEFFKAQTVKTFSFSFKGSKPQAVKHDVN